MRRNAHIPFDFDRLGARQRAMVSVICASGGATIREIRDGIDDPPDSNCGLRTQLNRLVRKGLLRTRPTGRHSEILYLPSKSWPGLQRNAFERLADEHFGGSTVRAVHELMKLAAHQSVRNLGERRSAA